MRSVAETSLERLKSHYVMHENGTIYGHMSALGNAAIAQLIAERLRQPKAPQLTALEPTDADLIPGAGINLLAPTHFNLAYAILEPTKGEGAISQSPLLRMTPTSQAEEHYLTAAWASSEPGHHVLSLYVRDDPQLALRLQLNDDQGNAAIIDFVPAIALESVLQIKDAANIGTSVTPLGNNWLRLSVHASLPSHKGTVIVQMMKQDLTTAFPGHSEELVFQGLMLEQGQIPSSYCPPGKCRN
jgi:hypothetical protein